MLFFWDSTEFLYVLFYLLQRPSEGATGTMQDLRSFKLIMEYIKALPVSSAFSSPGYYGNRSSMRLRDRLVKNCTHGLIYLKPNPPLYQCNRFCIM